MSGAAVDSMMRHTQEKEIRDAADTASRLAAIVASSTDGIVTKDLTGKITSWNPACQAMFGYTADEVLGKSITILYPKGTENEEEVVLEQIRRGQPVRLSEKERVRKDGTTIWVSVAASPLLDAAGHVTGAAAIKRDLTATRALTKEREDARERVQEIARLQDINRLKTQFINMAAHELWTPLVPLRTEVHLLLTSHTARPTASQKESLDVIGRSLERLATLVEDLLTVARSEAGHLGIQTQPIDLANVLIKALETFQTLANDRGIKLTVPRGVVINIVADPMRISQVLVNLLSNAFKFTPKGRRISVELEDEGENVRVSVVDTGAGIAKIDLPRLFTPFTQVHDTTQVTAPGSGLGLYICKQFIELHGGTIGADSPGKGNGSTFWFTLPKRGAPRTPVPDADWSHAALSKTRDPTHKELP